MDLTGDGLADALVTSDDVFTWYASQGEVGYAPATVTAAPQDELSGPQVVFADPELSVHLADMSGDGLADLLRVRNGQVCYWPNLGYGRFGRQVVMDDFHRQR